MRNIYLDLRIHTVVPVFQNLSKFEKIFVGHGSILGSSVYSESLNKMSSLYDMLDQTEKIPLSLLKMEWSRISNYDLNGRLSCKLNELGFSTILSQSMFNFLKPTMRSCFDAVVFAKSFLKIEKDYRLTVGFGGDYSQTELLSLIWWFKILHNLTYQLSNPIKVEFHTEKHSKRTISIADARQILERQMEKKSCTRMSVEHERKDASNDYIISCLKNCRHKLRWLHHITKSSGNQNNYINFASKEFHETKCFIESKKSIFSDGLNTEHDLNITEVITDISYSQSEKITELVENYLLDYCVVIIGAIINALGITIKKYIKTEVIKKFYITDVGSIEVFAVHKVALDSGKEVVLLPHSLTAAHEFDIASYKTNYTYFSSRHIMQRVTQEPERLSREVVITDRELSNSLEAQRNTVNNSISHIINLSSKLSSKYLLRWMYKYKTFLNFLTSLRSNKLHVGYIANSEMDQFDNIINFKDEILFLKKLNEIINQKVSIQGKLFIRGKKSYFPVKICDQYFTYAEPRKNYRPCFDTGITSLDYFAKNMNIVFFIFTTSAILELMLKGVLCIKLKDYNIGICMDEDFEIPANIVPNISIDDLSMPNLFETKYLLPFKNRQYQWARLQTNKFQVTGGS